MINAWVPIATANFAAGDAPLLIAVRSEGLARPVSSAALTPTASNNGARRSKCWRAGSSVGAISAACRPASTT